MNIIKPKPRGPFQDVNSAFEELYMASPMARSLSAQLPMPKRLSNSFMSPVSIHRSGKGQTSHLSAPKLNRSQEDSVFSDHSILSSSRSSCSNVSSGYTSAAMLHQKGNKFPRERASTVTSTVDEGFASGTVDISSSNNFPRKSLSKDLLPRSRELMSCPSPTKLKSAFHNKPHDNSLSSTENSLQDNSYSRMSELQDEMDNSMRNLERSLSERPVIGSGGAGKISMFRKLQRKSTNVENKKDLTENEENINISRKDTGKANEFSLTDQTEHEELTGTRSMSKKAARELSSFSAEMEAKPAISTGNICEEHEKPRIESSESETVFGRSCYKKAMTKSLDFDSESETLKRSAKKAMAKSLHSDSENETVRGNAKKQRIESSEIETVFGRSYKKAMTKSLDFESESETLKRNARKAMAKSLDSDSESESGRGNGKKAIPKSRDSDSKSETMRRNAKKVMAKSSYSESETVKGNAEKTIIVSSDCDYDSDIVGGKSKKAMIMHSDSDSEIETVRANAEKAMILYPDSVSDMNCVKGNAKQTKPKTLTLSQKSQNCSSEYKDTFQLDPKSCQNITSMMMESSDFESQMEPVRRNNKLTKQKRVTAVECEDKVQLHPKSQDLCSQDMNSKLPDELSIIAPREGLNEMPQPKKKRSLEKPDESEVPKGAQDKQKEMVLNNWIIMQSGKTRCICVEGEIENGPQDEFWHSSGIVKVLDPRQVVTKAGTVYKLVGSINTYDTKNHGFPDEMIKAFTHGFPNNWKELVKRHFEDVKRASRKGKEKKCNNTSTPVHVKKQRLGPSPRVVVTPFNLATGFTSLNDLPTTRSGRKVKPALAWWAGQRICVEGDGKDVKIVTESPDLLSEGIKPKERARSDTMAKKHTKTKKKSKHKQKNVEDTADEMEDTEAEQETLVVNCSRSPHSYKGKKAPRKNTDDDNAESKYAKTLSKTLSEMESRKTGKSSHESATESFKRQRVADRQDLVSTSSDDQKGSGKDPKQPENSPKDMDESNRRRRQSLRDKKPAVIFSPEQSNSSKGRPRHCKAAALQNIKNVAHFADDEDSSEPVGKETKRSKPRSKQSNGKHPTSASRRNRSEKGTYEFEFQKQNGGQRKRVESDKEEEWTEEEIERLLKGVRKVSKIDKGSKKFWSLVAAEVKSRTADECLAYYEEEVPEDKKKAASAQITAKVGTMKRKRELRQLLDHYNDGYDDDIFNSTPFKKTKTRRVPDLFDSEDEDVFTDSAFRTPASNLRYNCHSKGQVYKFPGSEKKTPHSSLISPGLLHPVQRNAVDLYFNRVQRARKVRPKSHPKEQSETPHARSKDVQLSQPISSYRDLFDIKTIPERDSEEEEDYYWSDEN